MDTDNNVLHIKVPLDLLRKLQAVSVKEARTVHQVARLALTEIATRGWTDVLTKKERRQ